MMNLTSTLLPYTDNLLPHYAALSDLPGFSLLDCSAAYGGRYDILSAMPYDQILVQADAEVSFKQIKAWFNEKLPKISSQSPLPFQGGGIGYFSYDFGAREAGIYSKPHPLLANVPLVDIQFYDWGLVTDHQEKRVHLVSLNNQRETSSTLKLIQERWKHPRNDIEQIQESWSFSPLMSRQEYQSSLASIHQYLTQGRVYQVNYTQPFVSPCDVDPWHVYQRVRTNNPVPYAAFLRRKQEAILSFSPEQFLSMYDGKVVTSPIKGTSKRSSDARVDQQLRLALLNSEKDRAENTMIVDLLRNDLGKRAVPGSVVVPELCAVHSFNSVHHLVSRVEATCERDVGLLDMIEACFPGGSITGAPKLESMKIIHELEAYSRSVYCGSIGYFSSHGRMDTNIAIRTAIATQNMLSLSVGGGIVLDSSWEDEYEECLIKIKAIVDGLSNVS